MKRYLPFIIIALVALVTVGIAATVYRIKMRPTAPPLVASASSPVKAAPPVSAATVAQPTKATPTVTVKEEEDESLHVHGPKDAPVNIEMYGDFQCPPCANAATALSALEKQYAGKLRITFHEFPLAMHKHSVEAALAAEAAGMQGHFWEMHDMLFQFQHVWSRANDVGRFFSAYAESLGLDMTQFQHDAQNAATQARVIADGDSGVARGVKNTPTIFINGSEVRSPLTSEKFEEAIKAALANAKKS